MAEFEPEDAQAATGASVRVGRFETRDPVVHEQAAAPWDVVISPLSREFGSCNTYLATPRVTLYREQFSERTRIQGLAPPDTLAFALPVKCFHNSSWWKAPLHEAGLPFTMSSGLDVEFSAGQEHIIAIIDLELLRGTWPDEVLKRVESAARGRVLPASGDAVKRLEGLLGNLLDTAHLRPDMLHHPAAVQAMEQHLLDGIVRTISVLLHFEWVELPPNSHFRERKESLDSPRPPRSVAAHYTDCPSSEQQIKPPPGP